MRPTDPTRILLSLLLGAFLSSGLQAQGEKPKTPPGASGVKSPGGEKPETGKGTGDGGDVEIPYDPNKPKSGLNRFGSLQASVRPRRLAPGQSGTATFYFSVGRRYSVLSDSRLELIARPSSPKVSLGPVTAEPAELGPVGTPFAGKSYYGNIVKVTGTVTVAPGTAHGNYPASVLFRLPIADRENGRERGVYQGIASLSVPVGDPLPVIGERDADRTARPRNGSERQDTDAPRPTPEGTGPGTAAESARTGTGDGRRVTAGGADEGASDGDEPLTPPVDGEGDPILLIVAGVAVLGIVGLLLARKPS